MACIAALLGHLLITRSAFGTAVRGLGGNAAAMAKAGWSTLRLRATVYAAAGGFGVIAGLMLLGQSTSADANIASRYTLISVAAVILGGGEFSGGRVSPVGAVIGALTMTLAASFLTFLSIAPDWQIGMQGLILIGVLGLRAAIDRWEERA
jgi:ribose transport system permease protein